MVDAMLMLDRMSGVGDEEVTSGEDFDGLWFEVVCLLFFVCVVVKKT